MLGDSAIFFYNGYELYTLWTSGAVKNRFKPTEIEANTSWDQVTQVTLKDLFNIKVPVFDALTKQKLLNTGYFFNWGRFIF